MQSVPDPLEDAVAGMAALLNEQVPDGNPNMFIQQLGSRVHHPEEQKENSQYAPLPKPLKNHHMEVKGYSNSKEDQIQEGYQHKRKEYPQRTAR
jgi:hypothetical protein